MILRDYLDNPMGAGDSSIVNRQLITANLNQKYNELTSKKKIEYFIYRESTSVFLIHLIIPSESERDNSYDVVFRFAAGSKEIYNEKSIRNYDVQVFSNSPSFAYTFANVYEANDLLVKSLKSKFDPLVFKKDPVVRNKYKIVNYEKYIYFGAKFIMEGKLFFSKEYLIGNARIYNPKKFSTSIRDMDTIMVEYQRADRKVRESKRLPNNQNISRKSHEDRVKQPKSNITPSSNVKKKITASSPKQPKQPKQSRGTKVIKKK